MQSIKAFFNRITQCSIDPASYRQLRSAGLGSAYLYLYSLLLLTAFVSVLWLAAAVVQVIPTAKYVVDDVQKTLPTLYPPELIVTVQTGALTTNVREPYAIPVPEHWKSFMEGIEMDQPKNLAVFDTKATSEDYDERSTLFLFTKSHMIAGKDDGELRLFPYDRIEEKVVMTNAKYQDVLKTVFTGMKEMMPMFKGIVVVGFILSPFVIAGFALLWWMFLLLLSSLLLWFVSSMAKWGYTYNEIYRLSVYGATPVIILGMLFWIFALSIPFVLQIYFFVWMWIVLKKLR